jgi:alpha-tubulin suppressor-like RCC1 family protein
VCTLLLRVIPTPTRIELPQQLANDKLISVACGLSHTLLLTESGRVYSWGSSEYGATGLGQCKITRTANDLSASQTSGDLGIQAVLLEEHACAIACGARHSLVVTRNGACDRNALWVFGSSVDYELASPDRRCVPQPTKLLGQSTPTSATDLRIESLAAGSNHTLVHAVAPATSSNTATTFNNTHTN